MIGVKLYDSVKNGIEEREKQQIIPYRKEDFFHIIQGDAGQTKPFRDDDSLRFIREIDKAEFAGGDNWYSIITPYGRTSVTALCGGTRYALTLLHNSRRDTYTDITDFSGYGKDIWSRLAVSATDILIAYDAKRIDGYCPELPIHADYFIENYSYERGTIEAYVRYDSQDKLHKENGKYYTGRYLHELEYHWYRDIGGLIAKSERLIQNAGKRYDYPPREYSVFEFAKTLEDRYANAFEEMEYPCEREYLEKRSLPEQEYRAELEKLQQTDAYREYVL